MAKLNTNSNVYTIVYASVMVIIVAFLLAFVASSLKETQDANVARDVKGQILSSVNLRGEADVDGKYAEVITENENGTFTANINGEEKLIVPLKGAGLWGPIWGYISVNKDGETVYGAFFNHEGETAGLGARIVEEWFQTGFNGKKIFKDNEVALGVYKAGKAPSNLSADYVVDAVTGATLTSDGVRNMLQKCIAQYADAIKAFKGGESKSCDAKPCCGEGQCEMADSCCADSCADCASSCDECDKCGACKAEKECGACCESDNTNK
jgi:Na+-transporting NADH:ubiquinone oxidoreductase subunit C